MKIVFLDAGSLGETPLDEIAALGELVAWPTSTPAQVLERVGDCEVLIVNKVRVTDALLARAPRLRLVCESATGVNNIDLEACAARGIPVRNAAGYSTEAVVQSTFAHLLSLAWFYGRNEAFSEVADQINRAKILISEQFRTITPEDVAQQLCMGYSNFRRIFKEYTGFSPAKYIQEVKMGKVKEALTNSTRPVKQVAYEMGYENEDYFFTAFRRLTGMTPVEYRKFTQGKRKE